jgi:iron(III) transport system permease protein
MTTLSQSSADLTLRTRLARGVDALRQEWLRSLIMLLAVLTVGGLVLYPLGILFNIGFRTEDGALTLTNYYSVLTEPGLVSALINSLIVSAATTGLSLVIALPMAWAVARTAMPGRQLLRVAVLIAFVIPNFISVIAWILLLGPNAGLINVFLRDTFGIAGAFNIYSMGGLILVLTFSFYPLIFFAVTAALDNMDPAYEEAAQMAGASAWRASLGVTMPLVLPAIVSASVFVFLEAMGAFGAPAAIGHGARFHTLTTKIYELFSYPPRFELAAAAAAPIIGFTVLGLLLQRVVLRGKRFTIIGGKRGVARAVDLGKGRWLLFGWCMLVVFVSVVLPLVILVRTSLMARWGLAFSWENLTLRNYASFASASTIVPTAFLNSALISAVVASACVVLGMIVVWIVERTSLPGRGLLTFASTVTFAFPGVALAVGFVLGFSAEPLALFGTIWLFFIAFTAHRFPFAFMFLRNSVKQLSSEMEEAGRVCGASWVRSLIDISAPLIKSGLLAAWMVVFAVTLRELSMAILLYVPGTETLPIAIYSFIDNGTFEIAAALSVVLILLSIAAMLALRRLTGKAHMEL